MHNQESIRQEPIRKVTQTYAFPRVTVDLMEAQKCNRAILTEDGNNGEHIVGAEMATSGSMHSSWRYIGSAGPNSTPCNPLSYVPANVPWGTRMAGEGHAAGIVCRFDPQLFYTMTGLGADWPGHYLEACRDLESLEIRNSLQNIYLELNTPGFATDVLIDTLANLVLIHLARYFKAIPAVPASTANPLFSRDDLLVMRRSIEASSGKRIAIHDLAAAIGYSTSHFHSIFKESTGITPYAFTLAVRLQKASQLLQDGKLPIKEIAWRAGFRSQSSFSTAFHRHTGKTPAAARSGKYLPTFRYPLAKPAVREALAGDIDIS